jgi:hypothetical protein
MLSNIRKKLSDNWEEESGASDDDSSRNNLSSRRHAAGSVVMDKQLVYQTEYNTTLMKQLGNVESEYLVLQKQAVDQEEEIDTLKKVKKTYL